MIYFCWISIGNSLKINFYSIFLDSKIEVFVGCCYGEFNLISFFGSIKKLKNNAKNMFSLYKSNKNKSKKNKKNYNKMKLQLKKICNNHVFHIQIHQTKNIKNSNLIAFERAYHYICIIFALYVYNICIIFLLCLYYACILFVFYLYYICIKTMSFAVGEFTV